MTSASEKVLQKNRAENSVFCSVFWKLLPTLIVLAALGLGLFLRYYRLASIPPLLWYDEAFYINRARDVLETGRFLVYFKAHGTGAHPILVYLIAGGGDLIRDNAHLGPDRYRPRRRAGSPADLPRWPRLAG